MVGLRTTAMAGVVASKGAGQVVEFERVPTVADGVGVAGPSDWTFALIERYVDEAVTCSEEGIVHIEEDGAGHDPEHSARCAPGTLVLVPSTEF